MNFRDENCKVMTPFNPNWELFIAALEGPDGCDFKPDHTWKCAGGHDKSFAQKILEDFGLAEEEVNISLQYFEVHGGHCDCEILFNVDGKPSEHLIWTLEELEEYKNDLRAWVEASKAHLEKFPDDYECVFGCHGGLKDGEPCKCPNGWQYKLARRT